MPLPADQICPHTCKGPLAKPSWLSSSCPALKVSVSCQHPIWGYSLHAITTLLVRNILHAITTLLRACNHNSCLQSQHANAQHLPCDYCAEQRYLPVCADNTGEDVTQRQSTLAHCSRCCFSRKEPVTRIHVPHSSKLCCFSQGSCCQFSLVRSQ